MKKITVIFSDTDWELFNKGLDNVSVKEIKESRKENKSKLIRLLAFQGIENLKNK